MHTKLLIDSILRQTTVLIAQLSSAAGLRAPLSHLADEVFLSLSKELEEQGVSRKVVADMFGLALRSYQRRVQRLQSSVGEPETTLWQAMLDYIQKSGQVSRQKIWERFTTDDPEAIGAVLNDLIHTGLVSRTGSSTTAVYAATSEEARRILARLDTEETATALVWLDICHHPGTEPREIAERLAVDESLIEAAVKRLSQEGRITSQPGEPLTAEGIVIDVGSEVGWETAVFDHFQAATAAISAKLRLGATRAEARDTTGGTTLSFELGEGHPYAEEVLGLLGRFRRETDELFAKVSAENQKNPPREDDLKRVVFYFGQLVKDAKEES